MFGRPTSRSRFWKPPALRAPVLLVTILICWGLIALLQYLLVKSQRDGGVILAPKINELPLSRTFLYLYFPTILAVTFSIYWAWIDLETKRLEPYYQLSKEDGALGKDSLLLQYPFDFIPLVPFKALKDRHWPVFWASFAVVLVTWGLVPTQAGIFSVRTIIRSDSETFITSARTMPVDQQASTMTFKYAQSTYGIVALNETLPPYMARNYTLAPFKPLVDANLPVGGQGTWTGNTTMYFLELYCEDVSRKGDDSEKIVYTSSSGCNLTTGLTGNDTMGDTPGYGGVGGSAIAVKEYMGLFVGYHNGGFADYSLDHSCPESDNTTFYAAFSKSKLHEEDTPSDVTAVFCRPTYYYQPVSATVDALSKEPQKIEPLGDKKILPWNIFNSSMFETSLNAGTLGFEIRSDALPSNELPTYLESLAKTNISILTGGGGVIQPMVGLAFSLGTRPLADYLDWQVLSKAYADAYRLLFARAMVVVLGNDFAGAIEATGTSRITTEAVILEPVFVYIVEGFLGAVSLLAIALFALSFMRMRKLRTNPSTVASLMAIVADNASLLSDFSDLDCCTVEDMQKVVGQRRYKLVNNDSGTGIVEVTPESEPGSPFLPSQPRRDSPSSISKPIRPTEFSFWVAVPVVSLFILLAVMLGIIYGKAKSNGLALPSQNSFVQNVLENYIPTAIATLIEPMWILINRLLCMLQPLEELQDCKAKAKKSIDADYNSLPPQLVLFQAFSARHFILAAVCTMALLANVLAVAFAGLFNQAAVDMRHPTMLDPGYNMKFVAINGTIGPKDSTSFGSIEVSGAYQGGDGKDQFLVAESNFSRNTPLPSWTDDSMFYLPLFDEKSISRANTTGHQFEAATNAFGANLDCNQLELGNGLSAVMNVEGFGSSYSMSTTVNITIATEKGDVGCGTRRSFRPGPISGFDTVCVNGPGGLEQVATVSARTNATQYERDVCSGSIILSWYRNSQGSCPLGKNFTVTADNSLFLHCRPKLLTASANIKVDTAGRLMQKAQLSSQPEAAYSGPGGNFSKDLFSNDPINLIAQSNKYMFKYLTTGWHNDSFASDFINYFMIRASNTTHNTDPTKVPTFDQLIGPLNKAYSKLFAIWLGVNKEQLLVRQAQDSGSAVEAWSVIPEQRIFVSKTMFIISEIILCTYAIVAIFVYIRRPGQYLARMPTSIAAVIALFAASSAVQDMRGTSNMDRKQRAKHLEAVDARYGYGSYVGGVDGRVHIGIEKTPFVRLRSKTTWLEKRVPLLRKKSGDSDV